MVVFFAGCGGLFGTRRRFSNGCCHVKAADAAAGRRPRAAYCLVSPDAGRPVHTEPWPKSTVRDGPFAEAKEMIGGFLLLTCDTREQAIEIARECPAAEWATIEVRELGPCFQ